MPRPTSFRLSEDLLQRLDDEVTATGSTATALVTAILDEGLKARRFPGITYRDGPAGRRAGIVGGPDVWEIVRSLKQIPGTTEQRIHTLAEEIVLPAEKIREAVDFYGSFSDEVDDRIKADDQTAEELRQRIDRRDHLLSS